MLYLSPHHRVTQLGSESPTPSEMEAVLQERSRATQLYLHHYCHEPVAGSEFTHTHTQCFYRRTCRLVNEVNRLLIPPTYTYFLIHWWMYTLLLVNEVNQLLIPLTYYILMLDSWWMYAYSIPYTASPNFSKVWSVLQQRVAKEAERKTGVCQGCQESLDTGLDTTQKEIVTYIIL